VVGATNKTEVRFTDTDIKKLQSIRKEAIPAYTSSEAKMVLDLYLEKNIAFSDENIDRLLLISGGNPLRFLQAAKNPHSI
jgi:hypothetical protein